MPRAVVLLACVIAQASGFLVTGCAPQRFAQGIAQRSPAIVLEAAVRAHHPSRFLPRTENMTEECVLCLAGEGGREDSEKAARCDRRGDACDRNVIQNLPDDPVFRRWRVSDGRRR